MLFRSVKELCKLQGMLPGALADLIQTKKEGRRPSEARQRVKCAEFDYYCDCWESLKFNSDGLLTIALVTSTRAVCLFALCWKLI